tara:strand:- start:109 stop:696 length:588 start_codon:yes stop_codon:yes gene_type:complete
MKKPFVAKIYPTLVFKLDCSDLIKQVSDICNKVEWKGKDFNDSSSSNFILSKNVNLTSTFNERINLCLKELDYKVPFKMSTSWFTRTKPEDSVWQHKHTNSVWSAVFYFDDNLSNLVFDKRELPMISVDFNNTDPSTIPYGLCIFPVNIGDLIIFPSDLYHASQPNTSNKYRYSLAMNFMPYGMIDQGDSSYHYQ